MLLKIALRNIFRNRSRSALSILMIAGAVSGIIIFRGFSDNVLNLIRETAINNEFGHIQVGTHAFWEMSPGDRKAQFILDMAPLVAKIETIAKVTSAAGRLSFFGLLSTGDTTVSAKGIGFDPKKETQFSQGIRMHQGQSLRPDSKNDVIVGTGLQKQLSLTLGQNVTALTYTLDGVVNAMDLTVAGVFSSGIADFDNHVFMLPLSAVQTLMDTSAVENLSIRVEKTSETDSVIPQVRAAASELNASYETKSWYDLATLFRQVELFYIVQNRVIECILVSLVLLGIMNTVGMSVFERTGEIGTVRALGATEKSIIFQFTLEGALLGLIGVVVGWVLGTGFAYLISSLGLQMELPNSSAPIHVHINRVPMAYIQAALIGVTASIVATWIPSVRAAKISIVEALKKNI